MEFNRQLYKVIGVMGVDFQWPSQTDLWAPLGLAPEAFSVNNTFNESYFAIARLQPGATFSNAASFLNLASQRVSDDPATEGYPKASGWSIVEDLQVCSLGHQLSSRANSLAHAQP